VTFRSGQRPQSAAADRILCGRTLMRIAFPQQHGYTNVLQYYIKHTLPVLLCHDFMIVLDMVLKYFDNYTILTKNLLTLVSATLFQYACQSNLPSTVRVLVQIGFANIQARNSDTGNCYKKHDKHFRKKLKEEQTNEMHKLIFH